MMSVPLLPGRNNVECPLRRCPLRRWAGAERAERALRQREDPFNTQASCQVVEGNGEDQSSCGAKSKVDCQNGIWGEMPEREAGEDGAHAGGEDDVSQEDGQGLFAEQFEQGQAAG